MPELLSVSELTFAAAVILVAYFVRGIAGFGSGLIAVPLLALVLPLQVAVPIIVLLDYIASASHGLNNRDDIQWHTLLPLLPFTAAGVLVALHLFETADPVVLKRTMGVFVVSYAAYNLLDFTPHSSGGAFWAAPAGAFGGLIGTLFGTGGPFYVIYLKIRGLNKTPFRATFATVFLIDGAARLTGYFAAGFFILELLYMFAAALPMMVLGMYVGGRIHTSMSEKAFQRAISVLLIGSGIALLLQ